MGGQVQLSAEEWAQKERFEAVYLRGQSPVMLAIERGVCGCDYGGDSWTIKTEADKFIAQLSLDAGVRLLELGSGAGWPGLYMTSASGCDTVLVDLPLAGLHIAAERAQKDNIAKKIRVACADAGALPFPGGSFDAISHSDLLCCLKQKRAVLSECRRVIGQGGRMAFTVIYISPGLSLRETERALANGPEFVEAETDYPTLLAQTGWTVVARENVTASFAASCQRQFQTDEAHEDDLVALIGADEFSERVEGWRSKHAAINDNLIRRELFVATPIAGGKS